MRTKKTFAKNLEFQNQKTGFKNVAVLEKEEKKSFKKTENKLATENGKQKLKAMMDDIPTFHYIYMFL